MELESDEGSPFEIGHVLFLDIVGYSKLLIEDQKERLRQLTSIVLGTAQVRESTDEQLVRLPTGDGMALVFRHSAEEPARCALEIAAALRKHPELPVRMGIHSGPVSEVIDVSGRTNIAGAGINMAQRVMDCGDAGHILLSQHVADDLMQYRQWAPLLHDLGECEVKHGVLVSVVNLYRDNLGKAALPAKFAAHARVRKARNRRYLYGFGFALASLVLLALVLYSLGYRLAKSFSSPSANTAAAISDKSIAVLPFENLSDEKANAYFAEGIQDEILTRVSKIGALKVISRTSTARYASSPQNLPEIARQLKVANILEGSVQKVRDSVRVNVQLIRAASDDHLWAESYDRTLTDIFGVEAEVAQNIASNLNAKLTGTEQELLAQKPTNNPGAYDAYLRGLAFQGRIDALLPNLLKSIEAFQEAVRLDPDFAVAWARLASQQSFLFILAEQTPQNREAARQSLERAKSLGPNLVETKLADGCYRYWVERDYEGAKRELEMVRGEYPNDYLAVETLAEIARRQGQWEESQRLFGQAIDRNPQDISLLVSASWTDLAMRDTSAAQKILEHARDLSPKNTAAIEAEAICFQLTGDVVRAQALLDQAQPAEGDINLLDTMAGNAILSRNFGPAIAMVKGQLEKPESLGDLRDGFESLLGDLLRHAGDPQGAAMSYRRALAANETLLQAQPNNPSVVSTQAWIEAQLGEKAAALTHAKEAIALLPASRDAWLGPDYEETLARIEAHFGDKENAIASIQHLLRISYGSSPLTPALLRLDPDWDNLRGDPRFEKLCQKNLL